MSSPQRRVMPLAALLSICGALWALGTQPPSHTVAHATVDTGDAVEPVSYRLTVVPHREVSEAPSLEWPDTCERLRVDDKGKLRRIRRSLSPGRREYERKETRTWLLSTAQEFEPHEAVDLAKALRAFAVRDSSYRSEAMHVLDPDLNAARHSAKRLTNARLAEQISRDNFTAQTWFDTPTGPRWRGAWWFSRGLYGMAPSPWLFRWGDVPPWALCDRRVSTAVAIWALRDHLADCVRKGYPSTWRTLNRRFASGHCRPRAERYERAWTKRAEDQGLDPDAPVSFQRKRWQQGASDRRKLLAALEGARR